MDYEPAMSPAVPPPVPVLALVTSDRFIQLRLNLLLLPLLDRYGFAIFSFIGIMHERVRLVTDSLKALAGIIIRLFSGQLCLRSPFKHQWQRSFLILP